MCENKDLLFGKMQNFDLGTPQQFQTGVTICILSYRLHDRMPA